MHAHLPISIGAWWFRKSTDVSPVVRNGSRPQQRCGARRRRQGTVHKCFVSSTEVVSATTSPRSTIEITCNQVNVLRNHDGTKSKNELLGNAFLFGIDIADMQGQNRKNDHWLRLDEIWHVKEHLAKPIPCQWITTLSVTQVREMLKVLLGIIFAKKDASVELAIHSVSLSLCHHMMSLNIDMKIIRPWNCSGSPTLLMNFWTSWTSSNVVDNGKMFHSNPIGSPSIVSKVLSCDELLNQVNFSSHATFDCGFLLIFSKAQYRI